MKCFYMKVAQLLQKDKLEFLALKALVLLNLCIGYLKYLFMT